MAWWPAETVLSCKRNGYFLQKVCSCLRKTLTWETRLVDQAPTRHPAGRTGTQNLGSSPGPGPRLLRRTAAPVYAKRLLSVKSVLPLTRNTTFSTLGPAAVTPEAPLAEPSWAAQHKREPDGPPKNSSRVGKTLIDIAPLRNARPGDLPKLCSRARETLTLFRRCAPVYAKH